jgi:hypothetical protein
MSDARAASAGETRRRGYAHAATALPTGPPHEQGAHQPVFRVSEKDPTGLSYEQDTHQPVFRMSETPPTRSSL